MNRGSRNSTDSSSNLPARIARRRVVGPAIALAVMLAAVAAPVAATGAAPSFFKVFSPDTIGLGSTTTLVFTIGNANPTPVLNLAFSDTLPAGVLIATPALASTTCRDATLTAPAGGSTIVFTGGRVEGSSSCTVRVNVTGTSLGTKMNVSGDLTSDHGNSGAASDDLMVVADRPGFVKSFSPSTVPLGGRSTLTFTIDNTANPGTVTFASFSDALPAGLVIAGPANASTTCGGTPTFSATPGGSVFSYTSGIDATVVAGNGTCTVSVDVVAVGGGQLDNLSSELEVIVGGEVSANCGKATAVLTSTLEPLHLSKSFIDDPVPPGGTVTLEFTIRNFNRAEAVTDIAFDDNLDAALSGLVATAATFNDCGGMATSTFPTGLFEYEGGSLGPGGSCTIRLTLQVPAGAATGEYINTTTAVQGELMGDGLFGNAATDKLFVVAAPILTKEFTDDPVGAGGIATLEFTITNSSPTFSATDIAFTDVFDNILPTASVTPGDGCCGIGSTCTFTPLSNPAGPSSAVPAQFELAGGTLGVGESCTFQIELDVAPGAAGGEYPNTTTQVTATVDMESVSGPAASDDLEVYGAPTIVKEFVGDPVNPGDSLTLRFTLEHDELAAGDAESIAFDDDLDAALTGLEASGATANTCGGMATSTFPTGLFEYAGGTLAPGASCTIELTVDVPAGAPSGFHQNETTEITAQVLGVDVTGNKATDDLVVAGLVLTKEFTDDPALPGGTVTLEFTIQNVSGSTVGGIFFQDNLDDVISNLAAASGELPRTDLCGPGNGSLIGTAGDTLLTASGITLASGETCIFSLVLDVPAGTPSDAYPNVTQNFQRDAPGGTLFPNARDDLEVSGELLALTKEFTDDPVPPGGTVTLRFTLNNLDATQAASSIAFTDNLGDAGGTLAGLAAVGLPASDVCGAGSQISGTTFLSFTAGSLVAGGMCQFDVTLQVPAGAASRRYTNTTSQVTGTIGGLAVTGDPGTDRLRVAGVSLDKAFAGPVVAGDTVVLTFTLQNLDTGNPVSGLSFPDNLGNMLSGAVATDLPKSDVCGTGSQLDSTSSLVTFSGGNLPAGGSCNFTVTVLVPAGTAAGVYTNTTGFLTIGGLPVDDPATAQLTVLKQDFGDAPDPTYPTLLASDGARHTLGALFLGAVIDHEADGQPSAGADGDDLAGSDDEDGVAFTTPLLAGTSAGVDVTASASGKLDAWVDFNGDGDWLDAGEQIFTGQAVLAGVNSLAFAVPPGAAEGATYARFRVSTAGGLAPTGAAADGEVEDYVVTVVCESDLSVTQTAESDPAAAHTVQIYNLVVGNDGPSDATNVTLEQELPSGVYFLGAVPSSVSCTLSSGVALSCDLGPLAAGATTAVTLGVFIDGRFEGKQTTEAKVSIAGKTDPDPSDDEFELSYSVARARAMVATNRAGTPALGIVLKEAEESHGLLVVDAAGGGAPDISLTSPGSRPVGLAEVPNFAGTPSPELAILGFGFDGSVKVDVVDAGSTVLLGSYPVPGGPWVPIDLVSVPDFGGTPAPEIVVGANNLTDGKYHLLTLDASSGAVLRDVVDPNDLGFLVGIDALGSFLGSPASEIVAASATGGASFQQAIDPDGGGAVLGVGFTDVLPLNIAATDMGGSATAEGVALIRDALTGNLVACPIDFDPLAILPLVFYDPGLKPAPMAVVPDFGGTPAPELAVLGVSGGDLVVETRDLGGGALVGTSNLGAGLVPLGLAVHPSFAGLADPDVAVLFEPVMLPAEVKVFDASGPGPLFSFLIP